MFKEKITKESNTFTIEVSIEWRKFAVEEKLIYSTDPRLMLPEEIRNLAILKSSPTKRISNMRKEKYLNRGAWVFEVPEAQDKITPAKPAARRRRAKPKPKQENKSSTKPATRSIIKKEDKKTQ